MNMAWDIVKDVGAVIKRFVIRPRLEVYFDPSKTYHDAPDKSFGGIKGIFVHVMVANRGRTTAKQCRGLLTEVHVEEPAGSIKPAPLFRNPVELHWAHEPLECFAKDILPDDPEPTRLDVCYAHEGYAELHFFCEKRPRGIQTDFPPGRYKVEIRVRSEDGTTCSRKFLITFDGNCHNLHMKQLPE